MLAVLIFQLLVLVHVRFAQSNKDNTIFASIIAPSQSIFAYDMMDSWGLSTRNHYFLGCLAGVPFMGTTGLNEFFWNFPAAGNVVVVF